jgi:mycoredoxin
LIQRLLNEGFREKLYMKKVLILVLAAAIALNWETISARLSGTASPSVFAQNGEVVLYATAWCGYCKATRDLLAREGIAYREFDIENSAEGAKLYRAIGGRGVPVLEVGNQIIRGYNEKQILAAVKG